MVFCHGTVNFSALLYYFSPICFAEFLETISYLGQRLSVTVWLHSVWHSWISPGLWAPIICSNTRIILTLWDSCSSMVEELNISCSELIFNGVLRCVSVLLLNAVS